MLAYRAIFGKCRIKYAVPYMEAACSTTKEIAQAHFSLYILWNQKSDSIFGETT